MATCAPKQVNMAPQERFGELDIFKQPQCLVHSNDEMQLQINEAVLRQIGSIDVPLSVVGVCGVYRSGKSYLMNRLIGERKGFALGSSIKSQTKGIWVWCKCHPTVPNQVLILLDTEGLSDAIKRDQQHDTKIFCLSLLMSSVLIYNIKGVIDQDALKKLSFITEVTKVIGASESKDVKKQNSAFQFISPIFVLCLRDFFLDLIDEGDITSDDYMEICLQDSTDQQDDEFNSVRQCIKTFFPRRTCFKVAQPAMNKNLKRLETMPEEDLDEDFKKDIQKMVSFVYNSGKKHWNEVTLKLWKGKTFEAFLRFYIDALSKGKRMEYISAMQAVSKNHNEKLIDVVCQKYQAEIAKLVLPVQSKKNLSEQLMDIIIKLLREFREDAYPYHLADYEDSGMEKMKSMMDVVLKRNSSEVEEKCYNYLDKERKTMIKNNKERYDENFHEYEKDSDALLRKYHEKFDNYDEEERVMAFQRVIRDTKDEVLQMKHESSMREFKTKMDALRKTEQEDSKRKMDAWKKEQEAKLKEQSDIYKQRLLQTDEDSKRRVEELKKEQDKKNKRTIGPKQETITANRRRRQEKGGRTEERTGREIKRTIGPKQETITANRRRRQEKGGRTEERTGRETTTSRVITCIIRFKCSS